MHVGLNLIYLVPGYTGGTETYARELIPELVAAAPQIRFTAFISREAAELNDGPWGALIPAVTVPVHARNRVEWVRGEQQLLPRLAAKAGLDLLHSLANTAPAWGRFRRVVTIHDLNYRLVPEAHLGVLGLGMRLLVPLAARQSDRILTDTASGRSDLERLLRVPATKVDVVPLGVGRAELVEPLPEPQLRRNLNAGTRPIVLCVAAKRPHKNLIRLLGALAIIPNTHRPLLVLPGYPTAHENQLRIQAASLGISNDVRFLDWIGTRELEGLYASASCFVFPSLVEGFGLPVLEAMVRGVPVACSGRGSLAEVSGSAALHFDPESVVEIAGAIERLLSDPDEAQRLKVAGRERAATFTWAATAAATLVSYQRALSDRPRRIAA
jgi:glycosyltransferase involved in cell wall biosynthesis